MAGREVSGHRQESAAARGTIYAGPLGSILCLLLEYQERLFVLESCRCREESPCFRDPVHMLGYSLKVNPVQDINRNGALGVEEN